MAFEGSYLKIQPTCVWFSKQNIFVTTRDTKNSKLGLCRGRSGLSCHGKILVNTKSCWPNMWKFWLKWKSSSKNVIFSRGLESGGGFTGNRFVSMIRCSKHFGGTCFHPNAVMSSYLVNWRKKCFLKFWHFSFFWPFLPIFSLLKKL